MKTMENQQKNPRLSERCGGLLMSRKCAGGVVLVACMLVAGCSANPYAATRMQQRVDGMARTWSTLEASENSRPGKFAATADVADRQIRTDAQRLQRDLSFLDESLSRESTRFQNRQQKYAREIDRILRGKPETLEKTAVDLFY